MEAVRIEVCAVSPSMVASQLGVSVRTLRNWRSDLSKVLSRNEFDWRQNEPAIDEKSQKALMTYQQLIQQLGKRQAKQHLKIYGVI